MAPIRVMLVDDSPLFLASTARVLAADPGVEIVGRVLSGLAALEQISQLECDLVLVDLAMPEMNGLELAQRLKLLARPPRVVLLTLDDTPEYRAAALACADGFLDKSVAATQLVPLVHSLFATAEAG
jgi:DNA-binding NarL/FixJ family response regulator